MAAFIWPFCPESDGREEEYIWNTDILGFYQAEQRIALRSSPLYQSKQKFQISQSQLGLAKKILETIFQDGNSIQLPSWSDRVFLDHPVGGEYTEIFGDFRYSRFKEGNPIIIWQSPTSYSVNYAVVVSETSIQLLDPVNILSTLNNTVIAMPLIEGYIKDSVDIDSRRLHHPKVALDFVAKQDRDEPFFEVPEYDSNFLTYLGETAVLYTSIEARRAKETIIRSSAEFKTPSGPVHYQFNDDYLTNMFTLQFNTVDGANRYAVMKWLYTLNGRQKGFWLPSPNNDLQLHVTMTSSTSIRVKWIGTTDMLVNQHVCIRTRQGETFFRKITAVTALSASVVTLTIDSALPRLLDLTDKVRISYMHRYRLDTDEVSLTHENAYQTVISLACRRLPE